MKDYINSNSAFWKLVENSLNLVDQNLILSITLLFILLYFIIATLSLWLKSRNIKNEFNSIILKVKFKKDNRTQFKNKFNEIDNILKESELFSHPWREFTEHIIEPTDNNDCYKNSIQPGFFFNQESIIDKKINRRFVESIPGKLTGFGILGTFLGLTIGIAAATKIINENGIKNVHVVTSEEKKEFKVNAESHKHINEKEISKEERLTVGLEKLLGGASLAFVTSLLGLTLSITFSRYEKKELNTLDELLDDFVMQLEKGIQLITTEQINLKLEKVMKEQLSVSKEFSNDIAIALENSISKVINEPLQTGFVQIVQGIESLKNIQQNFSDDLMKNLVDKLSGGLSKEAQKNQDAAKESLENLQIAMAKQAQELIASQNAMASSSRELMNEMAENTKRQHEAVNKQIEDTIEKMTTVMKDMQDKMAKSVDAVTNDIGKAASKGIEESNNKILEKQNEATEQISKMQSKAREDFENSSKLIAASIIKMSEVTNQLNTTLDRINQSVDSVGQVQTNFSQIVSEQKDVANLFMRSSTSLNSASSEFLKGNTLIKESSEQINKSIETVKNSNQVLNTAWQSYVTRFEGVDEDLAQSFKVFLEGVEKFEITNREYIKDLSSSFERAVSMFAEQIDNLADVIPVDKK